MKLWILLQFSHKHQLSHVFPTILQVLPFPPSAAWKDKWLGHGLGESGKWPSTPTLRFWNPGNRSGFQLLLFFEFPPGFWGSFSMDSSQSWELRKSSCKMSVSGGHFWRTKISQICLQIHVHSFCVCLKKYASLFFVAAFFLVDSKLISLAGLGKLHSLTGTGITTDKPKQSRNKTLKLSAILT